MILTSLQKLPNNVGDLGKIIIATGFEWLPKVQKLPSLVTLLTVQLGLVCYSNICDYFQKQPWVTLKNMFMLLIQSNLAIDPRL